jgi:hypothetical protein
MNNNTSRPLDAVAALIMLALTLSWGLNQVSVKLALPGAVGVPLSTPTVLSVIPAGKLPATMLKVNGPAVPEAVRVWL